MKKDRKRIWRKAVRPLPREIERWTQALSSAEEFLQVSPEPLDAPHPPLGAVRIERHVLHVQGHRLHHPDEILRAKTGNRHSAPSTVAPAMCMDRDITEQKAASASLILVPSKQHSHVQVTNARRWQTTSKRRLVPAALVASDVLLALLAWWMASVLQGIWGRGALSGVTIRAAFDASEQDRELELRSDC